MELTRRLVQLGRGAEAVSLCRRSAVAWEKWAASAGGSDMYYAACIRAVLAGMVPAVEKTPEGARQSRSESDRAMAWLERAVAAGFKNGDLLVTDPALDALHARDDFKKLLTRLKDAGPR
jgi:hypothetical protein